MVTLENITLLGIVSWEYYVPRNGVGAGRGGGKRDESSSNGWDDGQPVTRLHFRRESFSTASLNPPFEVFLSL